MNDHSSPLISTLVPVAVSTGAEMSQPGVTHFSSKPAVSVVLIAHNLEGFIAEAIQSVLDQSLQDFELIIVDDGSTDQTPNVIKSFNDPRIVAITQKNQGPSVALNTGIWASRGDYIAIFSGDDVNYPDRLLTQLTHARDANKKFVFAFVDIIDGDSQVMARPLWMTDFSQTIQSQADLVRTLFYKGNCLNAVTAFLERATLLKGQRDDGTGPFHPGMLQLQDFELWMQLAKKAEFSVIQRPLVKYRVRPGEENLSRPTQEKYRRHVFEHQSIGKHFFENLPDAVFIEAFRQELVLKDLSHPYARRVNEAFLWLHSPFKQFAALGVQSLLDLMATPEGTSFLSERLGFNFRSLSDLMIRYELSIADLRPSTTSLYLNRGNGFSEETRIFAELRYSHGQIQSYFDFGDASNLVEIRWDPVEGALCRVKELSFELVAPDGSRKRVESKKLVSNGISWNQEFIFLTTDPWLIIPCGKAEWRGCSISACLEPVPFTAVEAHARLYVTRALEKERGIIKWVRFFDSWISRALKKGLKLTLSTPKKALCSGKKLLEKF